MRNLIFLISEAHRNYANAELDFDTKAKRNLISAINLKNTMLMPNTVFL